MVRPFMVSPVTKTTLSERESSALRHEALKEISAMLSRVESMRSAPSEELETQRLLTDVAKIKSDSAWLLDPAAASPLPGPASEASAPVDDATPAAQDGAAQRAVPESRIKSPSRNRRGAKKDENA